jgi:hypothetical protein
MSQFLNIFYIIFVEETNSRTTFCYILQNGTNKTVKDKKETVKPKGQGQERNFETKWSRSGNKL